MYELKEVQVQLAPCDGLVSEKPIHHATDAAELLADYLCRLDREVFLVLCMTKTNTPVCYNQVAIGTVDRALISMANVLKPAILSNSPKIILYHNHPSGDITPSQDDVMITEQICEAAKIMGIEVYDHIIVAGITGEYISLRKHMDDVFSKTKVN